MSAWNRFHKVSVCAWNRNKFPPSPTTDSCPSFHEGPYGVNGVPLKRVNQAYVNATSTKVKVGKVDGVTDATFARTTAAKKGGEDEFFATVSKVLYCIYLFVCVRLCVRARVCAC